MKLAIEQLQVAIGVTERKLHDAREAQKLHEHQAESQRHIAEHCSQTLTELRAAISALRAPPAIETKTEVIATEVTDKQPIEKVPERPKLSVRPRPDALKSSEAR